MEKTADYLTIRLHLTVMITIGVGWLIFGTSCDNVGLTRSRSMDWDEHTEGIEDSVKADDQLEISFEMENDTLKEEIEEVYFNPKK